MPTQPDDVPELNQTADAIADAIRAAAPRAAFVIVFAIDLGPHGTGMGSATNTPRATAQDMMRQFLARGERS